MAAVASSILMFCVVRILDKRFRFKAERESLLQEVERLKNELEAAQKASQVFQSYRTSTEPYIAQLKWQNADHIETEKQVNGLYALGMRAEIKVPAHTLPRVLNNQI